MRKPRPRSLGLSAAICVALCLAAGCRRSSEAPAAASSRAVRIAAFEPKSLDPTLLADGQGRKLAENLFAGLTARTANGQIIPGLSASWSTTEDGLEWTFVLREGVVWSDGAALTAEDVVWSFRRGVDPAVGGPNGGMFDPIQGAAEITAGKLPPEKLGATASGNNVVLRLSRPDPELPRRLATGWLSPAPRHAISAHGGRWLEPAHFVGSGPYLLHSHTAGQGAVLLKNPRFYDASNVAVERLELRFTSDVSLAWQWYELGEVDVVEGLIPPEISARLSGAQDPALRLSPFDGVFFVFVNTAKGPLVDVRVRQALDLAIDRQRLVRHVLGGGERATWSALPARMLGEGLAQARPRDLARAKALLAEAGFTAARPLALRLAFNTNQKNSRLAEALQQDLAVGLGVQVTLENTEWATFLSRLDSGDYELAQLNMGGFDALDFLSLFESGTPNRSQWRDGEYDAAVAAFRSAAAPAARTEALGRAAARLASQLPAFPLFEPSRQNLVRPGLSGFEATTDDVHPARYFAWMP